MEQPTEEQGRWYQMGYDKAKEEDADLLAGLEDAWEVAHELHQPQFHMAVGKAICEWEPCAAIRRAIAKAKGA